MPSITWVRADPGFSVGGGSNPAGVGAPTYDFAKFFKKKKTA